jgi:hypothetical protein
MKRGLQIAAMLGGGAVLAAFVALLCAISFGTFNLDPDSPPGSRWGDAFALAAGAFVFALAIFAARSRGLFAQRQS